MVGGGGPGGLRMAVRIVCFKRKLILNLGLVWLAADKKRQKLSDSNLRLIVRTDFFVRGDPNGRKRKKWVGPLELL